MHSRVHEEDLSLVCSIPLMYLLNVVLSSVSLKARHYCKCIQNLISDERNIADGL